MKVEEPPGCLSGREAPPETPRSGAIALSCRRSSRDEFKDVEKHVGFTRELSETDGAWTICRYIEATETSEPGGRAGIMQKIFAYNEEDLDATCAVMEWLPNSE